MRTPPRALCHAVPLLGGALLSLSLLSGCGSVVILAPQGDAGATTDAASSPDVVPARDVQPSRDAVTPVDAPRTCTGPGQCGPGEECQGGPGCGVPWVCGPALGRPCTDDLAPFCGCDGQTFTGSSTCPSRPYMFRGPCEGPPPPPPPSCALPNGARCALGERCRLDPCTVCVCSPDGALACENTCGPDAGARTCTRDSDCAPNGLCMGPEGCGVPWTCRVGPIGCTADVATFCGCDGFSFTGSSSCPGRPYARRGPCPDFDAGVRTCTIRGVQCPANSTCQIDRCTICRCDANLTASCAVSPSCTIDAGPSCAAQDARGEGLCDAFLGYAWNGTRCVGLSGCRCVGAGCASLFRSPAECTERWGHCPSTGP